MDWNPRTFRPYGNNITMPFFMAYPGYMGAEQERMILQDLEYLQQNYPNEVKRYQSRVAEILDKFDYEGSMIYDEYPDRYSLQRLAGSVIEIMNVRTVSFPRTEGHRQKNGCGWRIWYLCFCFMRYISEDMADAELL